MEAYIKITSTHRTHLLSYRQGKYHVRKERFVLISVIQTGKYINKEKTTNLDAPLQEKVLLCPAIRLPALWPSILKSI